MVYGLQHNLGADFNSFMGVVPAVKCLLQAEKSFSRQNSALTLIMPPALDIVCVCHVTLFSSVIAFWIAVSKRRWR